MFLGSSCCNIAENSTFARPLDFACRLNPSFHAFAEAYATETLGGSGHLVLLRLQSRHRRPDPLYPDQLPGFLHRDRGLRGVG